MASWLPRTQLPGQQVTVTRTTTPMLPGSSALLDLPGLGRLGHFLAVSTDAPAWVSLYSSAAAREADGSRPISRDPEPGSGVLLDLLTTTGGEVIGAPPGGTYFCSDFDPAAAPPGAQPSLRALVRNTGSSQVAIAVTVTAVVLAP
jgi:hypothetical protein